ncbi:NAD(P)/FAD-dependent oxidoreductase [Oscillospiraceae bacterium MB08-C2-2]|nr:NAD(P)/FAD-dependent oxidoreductase [Oscillospiraceae bacterium MB08-C2-2]
MANRADVIVIGAGAAGMLCAGMAAKGGKSVLLLEKMERPGRKLLITGKGRCNVTNNCDNEEFLQAVRTGSKFLYSAIDGFSCRDTMAFFEGLGVPLKTERGNRVFPKSDRSMDVVEALSQFVKDKGTPVLTGNNVDQLLLDGVKVKGVTLSDGSELLADAVVVATGGRSYPLTGSTGDGYRLARSVGHTVTALKPSLIPIISREIWCSDLMGLSLRNVTLSLWDSRKKSPVFQELGEMLFTHYGISGPLVLSASAHMGTDLNRYRITLDLKPGLDEAQLDTRLLRDFEAFANKDFRHSLDELLPRKLIPIIVELSGIPGDQKTHQITREQRKTLIQLLKALPITPKGLRPIEEAVVTSGGVSLKEVNPKTMESKLVQGLYFVGELLDLDAYTGGYNLQIAFSTGVSAARAIAGA